MRKIEISKRKILNSYNNVICVGYVDLWHLLYFKQPMFYTTRAEGWGCDIYHLDNNTCLTTGYAPFGNIKAEFGIVRGFEKRAEDIVKSSCSRELKEESLNELINEFVQIVLKMNE